MSFIMPFLLASPQHAWQEQTMSIELTQRQLEALRGYSQGEVTAIDLRRRLGGATYGEVLSLLGAENLPLPRAPLHGREEQLERARRWLFPTHEP
jgi:hypothetical protein